MDNPSHKLRFFISPSHPCNYLDNREATSLFADPIFPKDKTLYSSLVENGFRRSGEHLYKPYCENCSECIPVRIPVNDFKPSRNQKRNIKMNRDLEVNVVDTYFQEKHFQLYKKYIATRHSGGGMDNPTDDDYKNFLWSSWSDTRLFEFSLNNKLVAIAVVDELSEAFSAVYTFFDPDLQKRSPGKYAILYLIEHARKSGFKWLYLGYWIAECQKMKYKIEYQPIECLINKKWKKFSLLDFAVEQN
jgi:arginyl-tRNA--protein-N-Asp/Glu arginylyltransferase